jgi:hypothetical protein
MAGLAFEHSEVFLTTSLEDFAVKRALLQKKSTLENTKVENQQGPNIGTQPEANFYAKA